MQALNQRLSDFLFNIILSNELPREVKVEAYHLRVELETGQPANCELHVPSTQRTFYIPRPIYNQITEFQRAHKLIDGIKLMREHARVNGVELGLKDAKDIIDNWDDRL